MNGGENLGSRTSGSDNVTQEAVKPNEGGFGAEGTARLEEEIEDFRGEDEDVALPIRYSIMSYGADLAVDILLKRLDENNIVIPAFQRGFVWSHRQASRFVESLLLGLPVPEIFLFKEPGSRKLLVVDGQQRLLTLKYFHEGRFKRKAFRLRGVGDRFEGKTCEDLEPSDRRELDQSVIHATIFQQLEPSDDRGSVYSVFERLNSGGTALQAQEIRSSIYQGKLNDLLRDLAEVPDWKNLYGPPSARKRDEEIILRFLALLHALNEYASPMKKFLNDFMEQNRDPESALLGAYEGEFRATVRTVNEHLGPAALRPERPLNAAVADAVLVGVALRLRKGEIRRPESLKRAHERLLARLRKDELYQSRTTHANRLKDRIRYAEEEYASAS